MDKFDDTGLVICVVGDLALVIALVSRSGLARLWHVSNEGDFGGESFKNAKGRALVEGS